MEQRFVGRRFISSTLIDGEELLGLSQGHPVKTVGLCQSVQHTADGDATTSDPVTRIIHRGRNNHRTFYLKFERKRRRI